MNARSALRSFVVLLVLEAAVASAQAPAPAVAPAAPAAAGVDAGTAESPAANYSYNPVGKRDPFRSPFEGGSNAVNPAVTPCTEPLCQWGLDRLVLVAVVTGDANPVAMVEDPGGTGHILRRGTRLGQQGGKVKTILRDSVVVEEPFTTPDGKLQFNPRTLQLKKDEGDALPPNLMDGKAAQ